MSHKIPKFKIGDRVRITKYKNIFSKCYTANWSREIFAIDLIMKTNPCTYKIKDLKGEKYYPDPDSYIIDKVEIALELLISAPKRQLEHTFGSETCNLIPKSDFIVLKAEVYKLEINNLVNVQHDLNKLLAKIDDLHVSKMKTIPIYLKKLKDTIRKEVAKITTPTH